MEKKTVARYVIIYNVIIKPRCVKYKVKKYRACKKAKISIMKMMFTFCFIE